MWERNCSTQVTTNCIYMVKSRSDSITRQFNNSPQAESRTVPRQESPLPPIRQSCELVFELATRIVAAIPRPSLFSAFPFHVADDAPRRLQKFKAKFPRFLQTARLPAQTCIKKFTSLYSLNWHFKSKNKKIKPLHFNLLTITLPLLLYATFRQVY